MWIAAKVNLETRYPSKTYSIPLANLPQKRIVQEIFFKRNILPLMYALYVILVLKHF